MTTNTVPAILNAVFDPLAAITEQVQAALELAQRNKLPSPFIDTIQASAAALHGINDTLLDIATALDPDRTKPKP